MPLLKKKVFEKQIVPDFLRDDEEVFYCEITNEIFRDYHEFSERMFLCNSMVWTCSMTGKSNLTYQEALESEDHSKQCLKEFPTELKLPILFLGSLTKRIYFGEMAEDIYSYIKDRYFIGENVEACFTANKWKECHILSVIAPKEEQYKSEIKNVGSNSPSDRHFIPSANLYKYEIEHLDAEDVDISEIMIVDSSQLRRKKALFSKDKSKLFLKQYVEQDDRGIFVIMPSIIERFKVNSIKWDMIFNGPLPNFQCSKNFEKIVNGKKKHKQETLSKYLEKNGFVMKKENFENRGINLLEQMKKREEEFKKMKQLNEEQRAAEKQRKKVESNKLNQYFKIWSKHKEDLELEDHVKLPAPIPVKSKIPQKYFGDVVAILEFVQAFPKFLSTKDFFPGGFTLELIERALIEKEVAGPLTDLIQMLLIAIFNCQEDESNSYNTGVEILKDFDEKNLSTSLSLEEGTHLATLASSWSTKYQGLPLSRLPLYSLTVSEILRLHLLSSGARIKETGSKWRYAQRGGYTSEDDPGLYLRLNHAHVLKALAIYNVVQLSIDDKIKIILCLTNQLLSYADIRDVVEEKIENSRVAKIDLRSAKAADRKREAEFGAQKFKLKKTMKSDKTEMKGALEELEGEDETKRVEIQRKIENLMKAANDGLILLGRDRAYRKYLKIESVPGIFVNWEDEHPGSCLENTVIQCPALVNASKSELMVHIKEIYGFDKNNGESSPAKSPSKVNGIRKSLTEKEIDTCKELLLCTADNTNCPVHTENATQVMWSFYYQKEQIEELISSLNKRGIREGELKECLTFEKENLLRLVDKTPVSLLNPDVVLEEQEIDDRTIKNNASTKKKDRYEDANLGYPPEMNSVEVLENALIENVLEMEEKVTAGVLGTLRIKDRDKWRNCLQNKNYTEFEMLEKINEDDKGLKIKKVEKGKNNSRASTPEVSDKKEEKEYQDPGKFLQIDIDDNNIANTKEDSQVDLVQPEPIQQAIRCLSNALFHVAEAVDPKHLKKPLGHADIRSGNKHKDEFDVLNRWEQSLLASTSFSQIFLHYGTLDSCVMWSRSALLARCRICRRQKDSENMLLCDSCNLGHHMYCLKPKLTVVPKGDWFCDKCKKEKEKKEKLLSPEPVKQRRRIFVEEEVDEEEDQESVAVEDGVEEQSSEEELEEDDEEQNVDMKIDLCKTCGSGGETISCDKCHSSFHKECVEPPLRRLPRSPWLCPLCSSKRKHDSKYCEENGYNSDESDDEVINRRSQRRDDARDDLPLHNAALQELLCDVMKHQAAWPFLRPVQQKEVPDYYEIIRNPMDFGTIKYKLNVGEYSTDSQLLKDVVLVFENCNTYNSSEDEVYKCGVKLLKYFSKKAKQIGLKVPPELEAEDENENEPKLKKKRIK